MVQREAIWSRKGAGQSFLEEEGGGPGRGHEATRRGESLALDFEAPWLCGEAAQHKRLPNPKGLVESGTEGIHGSRRLATAKEEEGLGTLAAHEDSRHAFPWDVARFKDRLAFSPCDGFRFEPETCRVE
jgi:hypothetical protein